MAITAKKPAPAHLRTIGTYAAVKVPVDPATEVDPNFKNGLAPPCKLTTAESKVWDEYIRPCAWLTKFDDTKALMWVRLRLQYMKDAKSFTAGLLAQFRAIGCELGFDPSSRTRMTIPEAAKTKASKYFEGAE